MLTAVWAAILIVLGVLALGVIVAGWRDDTPTEIPPQVEALLDGGASGCQCTHCAWAGVAVHMDLAPTHWQMWEVELGWSRPAPDPHDITGGA